MAEPALELRQVCAGYGRAEIIHDVSFAVGQGERLALLGRNGAGKTTTLAAIMGQADLLGGAVLLDSADISRQQTHRRVRAGLGLVPQTRDIFPSLSVEENLLAGLASGHSLEEAYQLFPRLKERRKLGGAQLSGGEQQMLSIARTLLGGPRILLLDEPLEGLAPTIREALMETFRQIASTDRAIILVEQHIDVALDFAERAVILDAGRVVFDGATRQLRTEPEIIERHIGMAVEVR